MTTPERMTAIVVNGGKGPAEALTPERIRTPRPEAGQVLIRILAAGVNRPDIMQRNGLYPPPPGAPLTLGLEVAGEIAAVGAGVKHWREGDLVCALLAGGGYAEYCAVDARHVLPVPKGLTPVEAAGLPETVFTVFSNVFELGCLKPDETLMVHGATSGIGVMAIALAKAWGAKVIATSRGQAKAAAAKALGADCAIDAATEDFITVCQGQGGADVILDMVAGDYAQKNLDSLNPGGRLVQISVLGGAKAEVSLAQVMLKRLTITGSTLRPRDASEKARLAAAVEKTVWPWIEAGKVKSIIDRTFPLAEAAKAHAWLEAGQHIGKVVLTV